MVVYVCLLMTFMSVVSFSCPSYLLMCLLLLTFFMVAKMSLLPMSVVMCEGMVYCDFVSMSLIALTFFIVLMSCVASKKVSRMNLFNVAMVFLMVMTVFGFLVSNFFFFFFFFESSLAPLVVLIIGWGAQPERFQACVYMLLYTVFGSLFFLLGVGYCYMEGFSDNMMFMFNSVNKVKSMYWSLFMLGFLVKMPVYPFHLWLPKAHVEAPVGGSMMLAGVVLKLGGYGLLRFFNFFWVSCSWYVFNFILSVTLIGGCLCSVVCMRQIDMKCLVAYSSVSHMSLVIMGIFSNSFLGLMGSMMIMIGHGFCSSGLFSLVNVSYSSSGSRSVFMNKGYLSINPVFTLMSFMLLSSNMAAPPSLNLVGEIMVFMSVFPFSWLLYFFVGFMSFMAAGYSLFLYSSLNHGSNSHFFTTIKMMQYLDILVLLLHWLPLNLGILFLL